MASLVLEVFLSAPSARMLFHSSLLPSHSSAGRWVGVLSREGPWNRMARSQTTFDGFGTLLALLWAAALFFINRSFFWNSPIFIPLILVHPSLRSSRASVGRTFRMLGLLLIPEDEATRGTKSLEASLASKQNTFASFPEAGGFVRAIILPRRERDSPSAFAGQKKRSMDAGHCFRQGGLLEKALSLGPTVLSPKEKRIILYDLVLLKELHRQVWETPDDRIVKLWGGIGWH